MGPKVEACLRFVDAGGESVIASLDRGRPGDGRQSRDAHRAGRAGEGEAGAGTTAKPAAKAPGKAAGTKKAAARKQPAKRARRDQNTSGGADVIDITTARRRAVAE